MTIIGLPISALGVFIWLCAFDVIKLNIFEASLTPHWFYVKLFGSMPIFGYPLHDLILIKKVSFWEQFKLFIRRSYGGKLRGYSGWVLLRFAKPGVKNYIVQLRDADQFLEEASRYLAAMGKEIVEDGTVRAIVAE
ncbi:MAG TPA: hypothetical protein VGM23_04710 [Armatimonadota bacterium]